MKNLNTLYDNLEKYLSSDEATDILIEVLSGGKEEFEKFFRGMLKKFGVSSPAELKGDKKKEFFDAIDAGFKGDKEAD
jgi:hypothetical protein